MASMVPRLLIVPALVLTAPAALADAPVIAAFEAVDRDGNGVIDIDEYIAHILAMFDDLDTDDSQDLSHAEIPNVEDARFQMADRDGNGAISVPEAVSERVYETDIVPDGVLSLEEVLAAEQD